MDIDIFNGHHLLVNSLVY